MLLLTYQSVQSIFLVNLILLLCVKDSYEQETDNYQPSNNKSNVIAFIHNFFDYQKIPIKINAFLCWKNEEIAELSKTLHQDYKRIKVVQIKNHPVIEYPNNPKEFNFFVIDLECQGSSDILDQAVELKLFQQPFKWLMIIGDSSKILPSRYYFGVDSAVYVVSKNHFTITSMYKYSRNSTDFVSNEVGKWSQNHLMNFNYQDSPWTRSNLMGTILKVSYVFTNLDTINHLWDYRNKRVDSISKVNYILVHYLCEMLNVTRKAIVQRTWGYRNATTGLYAGLIGDLQQGHSDLGGTPSFMTIDRVEIVQHVAATTKTYMKFIFRSPPLSYVTNVFTLPFDSTVWLYTFVTIAVIGVVIYVIMLWEWHNFHQWRSSGGGEEGITRPSFFDVIMMEIGAISQQGTDIVPKSYAGRFVTFLTFFVLMFMYTAYSASIVALLQSTADNIKTLRDLLDSRIKLGVEDLVYEHYYFEAAEEPTRKAIYQQKIAPKSQQTPNFLSAEEGMRRVRDEFFGFHLELSTGYQLVSDIFQESEKCKLKEIEYINLIEPWLTVQKSSSYKEIIKIGMKRLHESGVQQREVNRIYTKKPVCHSKGSNFGSVGLIDCYSAFLIFGGGVATSLVLLMLEVIIMRYGQKKNRKNTQCEKNEGNAAAAAVDNDNTKGIDLQYLD